ncbi:hypothetical protein [Alicyclobacillus sp. SO9]|uniref:hypothetical protein n=1 Tax=Alicyclobacillus sp. SO9 TaxID=2665646 RepID=UPI0018E7A91F|nr:hypothetical protein [Alicyclobacillus sp. SO9]QQE79309.1 hypothetical protein GI364_02010 [Alicyclobacillus sp. SO9]
MRNSSPHESIGTSIRCSSGIDSSGMLKIEILDRWEGQLGLSSPLVLIFVICADLRWISPCGISIWPTAIGYGGPTADKLSAGAYFRDLCRFAVDKPLWDLYSVGGDRIWRSDLRISSPQVLIFVICADSRWISPCGISIRLAVTGYGGPTADKLSAGAYFRDLCRFAVDKLLWDLYLAAGDRIWRSDLRISSPQVLIFVICADLRWISPCGISIRSAVTGYGGPTADKLSAGAYFRDLCRFPVDKPLWDLYSVGGDRIWRPDCR